MEYTKTQRINGELAARKLSDKAVYAYEIGDPVRIYEIETEDGLAYDVDYLGDIRTGLRFEELDSFLAENVEEPDDINIIKLYKHIGRYVFAAAADMENYDLTLNHGRDGDDYWWFWSGRVQAAINVRTGEIVENNDRLEELFA